jgi:hypothetical protein
MLGQATRTRIQLKETGTNADVPDNDCSHGAYYLHCASNYNHTIPWELTQYRDPCIKQHKERIVEWMKKTPPSALPFIEMENLPGPSANQFYELGIESTRDALLLHGDFGAVVRRSGSLGRRAMFYRPSWLTQHYSGPLKRMQQGWEEIIGCIVLLFLVYIILVGGGAILSLRKVERNRF